MNNQHTLPLDPRHSHDSKNNITSPIVTDASADDGGCSLLINANGATINTAISRVTISELIRHLTNPETGMFPRGVTPKDLFDYVSKLPEEHRISKSRNHLQVCTLMFYKEAVVRLV